MTKWPPALLKTLKKGGSEEKQTRVGELTEVDSEARTLSVTP